MTFTPSQCELKDLENGWAFDGSSIRLFKTIEESDMIMFPVRDFLVFFYPCRILPPVSSTPFANMSSSMLLAISENQTEDISIDVLGASFKRLTPISLKSLISAQISLSDLN